MAIHEEKIQLSKELDEAKATPMASAATVEIGTITVCWINLGDK